MLQLGAADSTVLEQVIAPAAQSSTSSSRLAEHTGNQSVEQSRSQHNTVLTFVNEERMAQWLGD